MIEALVADGVFGGLLLFCRLGAALMLLPVFGEVQVPPRVRLGIAAAATAALLPVLAPSLPAMPAAVPALILLVLGEIGIGLFLGSLARILFAALHTAGMIVAFQSGLANAFVFEAATAQQTSLVGTLFAMIGLLLIVAADLHLLALGAVARSYALFPPGALPPVGDFAELLARTVAGSFALAMQMAAPFLALGLVVYLCLGLLARLMPNIQVFFMAIPLQALLAFSVMALVLAAVMARFLQAFEGLLAAFVPG